MYKARYEFAEFEKRRKKERKAKLEKIKKEQELKRKQEEEDHRKKEEEQRLRKETEEKLRQEHEERKRKEKEAADQFAKKQQRIKKQAEASKDRIISLQETRDKYQLFDMCPFVIAQTGMGLPIIGLGETKNKWQHGRCMKEYCRLWTWKIDNKGQSYAQGCSLQFLGLSEGEITKNFSVKNRQILEEKASPAKDETSSENKDIET
ncbi:MAG: hypothetical protein P8Y04_11285 [Desulfobulbaceae bacterium]